MMEEGDGNEGLQAEAREDEDKAKHWEGRGGCAGKEASRGRWAEIGEHGRTEGEELSGEDLRRWSEEWSPRGMERRLGRGRPVEPGEGCRR
jgi:hypothetical protein